jgi:hypothetical protein
MSTRSSIPPSCPVQKLHREGVTGLVMQNVGNSSAGAADWWQTLPMGLRVEAGREGGLASVFAGGAAAETEAQELVQGVSVAYLELQQVR